MSRKGNTIKRDILPDPVYNSKVIARTINYLMFDGKKNLAQSILYGAFKIVEEKTKKPAIDVFNEALKNIMPEVELKTRRIGAVNYQIPVEVKSDRKSILGIRWLITYARLRTEKGSMKNKLALEIIDASKGSGLSVKKRNDVHKMAEANKAYAHYRW